MKDKFLKTTLSSVKVDDVYEFTVTAEIDGANDLIFLTEYHKNTKNNIEESKMFCLRYEHLKQLNHIIKDEMITK